ncbi:excinuclease ABC subunit UvrC, partial [Acidicapsa dinghuensis]
MDLYEKIRTLPTQPGVYLYKNAEGQVIYVGKARNLRSRVRSYLLEANQANAKTGTLMREAVDVEYILVANEMEALALENNLIKQKKPRFNILLRDDKTYPYVKLTLADRYPKVFVTRRLRKDGSAYYGPYFPGNLAYRVAEVIHRSFLIPSCKVDLSRYHPRACLQYYIHRCLGPCVEGLTTPEAYALAVKDAQMFLEGRHAELEKSLEERMLAAAEAEQFELAARYRDLISTVHQIEEKQRIAKAESDDVDVFGYHYEADALAVNLFHIRNGKIVDRREMFWEELPEFMNPIEDDEETAVASPETSLIEQAFNAGQFFSALLKQVYIDQQYVPKTILTPVDFADREALGKLLAEKAGHRIELAAPQRGDKRSLIDLAGQNAKQSYIQRFRVLEPSRKAIQEALADVLMLPELPKRIECFDISHIQGAETVASMVVWEDGEMKKSAYRKFQVKTVVGVDDFASMREIVLRRYKRVKEENGTMPSLVLIDGGLGQLHAAADALEELGFTSQPLASIA